MGIINKGILGGFSGKVGSVVGGNWKGIDYMRSKAAKRNFIATQKQLEQQAKFALAVRFVQTMTGLADVGFGDFAVRQTASNGAVSYTLRNAITGTYPAYSILYANVLVSRGDLPNALAPAVTSGANSLVTWSWTNNSGVGSASRTDRAILAAYCAELNQCVYTTAGARRDDVTDSLNLSAFAGKTVQTWIGFVSDNGQHVANSLFTGEVQVS